MKTDKWGRRIIFLPAPGPYQGCGSWESSKEEILQFLKSKGVDGAEYEPGRMD